ncbi:protelomerase family protein (plasmid) [Nostoc sp. UHCC 0926]|uniref:protelomerase family protein n=1 Tax=Nostoc sp. UHCC 0926 TaxID=3025190 RepID=UPI00235FC90A|nr:protelomerase family protein [Nostoc sp. UHCC 0926]WDD30186.1 protelomerase family protein [Nostoc sp. UHCC 0926]
MSNYLDPKSFLEVTGNLLLSDDPHELAVGLIAATGRRPHEILARATFTAIPEESYHVQFSAQGKKRGKSPVFKIATLYPAEYIIKCLTRLRREPTTRALLLEVAQEFPHDREAQNRSIENRRGNSLRRVVQKFFGSKDDTNPVLPIRHGQEQEQDDTKSLRAAYGAIATERDCTKSISSQMLYYVRLFGHFASENPTDKDLQAVATSIGYADYYVTKSVPFPKASQKEKLSQVRVSKDDSELIKQLQKDWKLPNQQAVINCLIKSNQKKVDVATEGGFTGTRWKVHDVGNGIITLECLGHIPSPKWLDGMTFNGTVGLAPSTEGGFTGTRWKVHDVGNGIITLECLGHIPGSKWLDGRTFNGTVGLAPSTEGGFTGTRWKVHDVGNGIITLECLGHIPGSKWLDGRTFNGTVGLAPSTEGGYIYTGNWLSNCLSCPVNLFNLLTSSLSNC